MTEVTKDQITLEFLREVIENAGLETEFQESDAEGKWIDVKGLEIDCYVSLVEQTDYIQIRTYIKCRKEAPLNELPNFVCTLNKNLILLQFTFSTYEDGSSFIDGTYFMTYKFGFNTNNFIHILRRVSAIFINIRQHDPDYVFIR